MPGAQQPHAPVLAGESADDLGRGVGASVIHHHDLISFRGIVLGLKGSQAVADDARFVPGRHDHRNVIEALILTRPETIKSSQGEQNHETIDAGEDQDDA
jgi:hypothetical protein